MKPNGCQRRTFFDDDEPSDDSYFESDEDFVLNNLDLCLFLLKKEGLDPFFSPEGESKE